MLEEQSAAMLESLDTARAEIGCQESRIRFLEERLKQLTQPRALLTEQETAELLRVHVRTLKRWRIDENPPRICFIVMEGGDIRYRVEEIERYLKGRERGALRKAV
jgi:Helix-turn-helix domain